MQIMPGSTSEVLLSPAYQGVPKSKANQTAWDSSLQKTFHGNLQICKSMQCKDGLMQINPSLPCFIDKKIKVHRQPPLEKTIANQ